MSKRKFNLKNYVKISGDDHIEYRLKNEQDDKAPNEIGESQLSGYRGKELNYLTEKQLDDKRTGGADQVVERRLDKQKSKFRNSYRNKSAYQGDMNKLEEKRLQNNPVENEKYESASFTPKGLRWWEGKKSPDGLKIANKINKKAQVEELTFDKPRWGEVPTETGEEEEYWRDPEEIAEEEFDIIDESLLEDEYDPDLSVDVFEEVAYDEQDVAGTPMSIGRVKVNTEVTEVNEDAIVRDVIDFIENKHPNINLTRDSLDLSNLKHGEIGYVVSNDSDNEKFPIEEVAASLNSDYKVINSQKKI